MNGSVILKSKHYCIKIISMIKNIKLSILSGVMISIGCCAYLSCISLGYKWLGSILFAAGLYTICQFGFNLYTGKVGYIALRLKDAKYYGLVALILFFNLLTTYLLGILFAYTFPSIVDVTKKIYEAKLSAPLLRLFLSGIFCGILMFLSVDSWKQGSKIGVFIYIPAFIMAGFDHSIANSFYNGVANGFSSAFTIHNALVVLVVVLGNAAGGMTVPLLTRNFSKDKKDL